jgi:tetratricopeptide (TPR) repeat protein
MALSLEKWEEDGMRRRERSMQRSRPAKTNTTVRPQPRRSVRSAWIFLAILMLMLLGGLGGRPVMAWYSRLLAERQLQAGALSTAQHWLAWAAWFDPDDGRTDLLLASCFRRWQQVESFMAALESAAKKGVPESRIEHHRQLGLVQAGRLERHPDQQMHRLLEAGLAPHDVAPAFAFGFLICDQPEEASILLDAWAADGRPNAEIAYLRGTVWQWLEESLHAQQQWEEAIAIQPRHEQARLALAELHEQQHRIQEAWDQYAELIRRVPSSQRARLGMARLLRRKGHLAAAREVLESAPAQPRPSERWAAEMGQILFESGRVQSAIESFLDAGLDTTNESDLLRAAAVAFALKDDNLRAQQLLAKADAAADKPRRINELRTRLAVVPEDQRAVGELEALLGKLFSTTADRPATTAEASANVLPRRSDKDASPLYVQHCAACHGEQGHGDGHAAQHLFPRPLPLRGERFRLASTVNGVASLDDLIAVIERGVPGTSMPPFDNLSSDEQRQLALEVQQMYRQGVRERLIAEMQQAYGDEEIDEDEIDDLVLLHTEPGQVVRIPPLDTPTADSLARGRDVYLKLGCDKCHGDDGRGAADNPLFDHLGLPTLPRNLVHEPLKGGESPESIFLRLSVGMPGTEHPNSSAVPEDQLIDLVHYCRQLFQRPYRSSTNHERFQRAAGRQVLASNGAER